MPKRTNEFQRLVHLIHKGLELASTSVTESVMLKEQKTPSEREVDVLVERRENGKLQRIAIECRDRKREATLSWIDELIGKYDDLGVQKVVAVSKRGFSKHARLKAAAYGIECISMRRALSTDWPQQFIRPGMVIMPRIMIHLKNLEMTLDPPLAEAIKPSTILHDDNGHGEELPALWQKLFAPVIEKHIHSYMNQHFFDIFQTMGDLKKAWSFVCQVPAPTKPLLLLSDSEGKEHAVKSFTFHTVCRFELQDVPLESHIYDEDKALVSNAEVDLPPTGRQYSLSLIQWPYSKKMTILALESPDKKGKSKGKKHPKMQRG